MAAQLISLYSESADGAGKFRSETAVAVLKPRVNREFPCGTTDRSTIVPRADALQARAARLCQRTAGAKLRRGIADREHHRWYHQHAWHECHADDVHCRRRSAGGKALAIATAGGLEAECIPAGESLATGSPAKNPRDDRDQRADEQHRSEWKEKLEPRPVDDDVAWQAKQRQSLDPGPAQAEHNEARAQNNEQAVQ